jgi:hypothetical protein
LDFAELLRLSSEFGYSTKNMLTSLTPVMKGLIDQIDEEIKHEQ